MTPLDPHPQYPQIRRRQISVGLALLPLLASHPPLHAAAKPDEGIDYETLELHAPTRDPRGIEVVEFFRYGCPFCNRLEPILAAWKTTLAADVSFRYVPVSFHSTTHQQLYLTLVLLGEDKRLHREAYRAIHDEKRNLESLMDCSEWARTHGIDTAAFESAWRSKTVASGIDESDALVKAYGVTSVPQFGIQGRYRTSPAMLSGDNHRALQVVEHLIQLARA